ncbi:hypothetical protein ACFL6S_28935 [Candidatus Poribacteria bacterium]
MTLSFEKEDNRFRVEWQGNSIDWLPDTVSNRKSVLVFLRWLLDENNKHAFTHQELSKVVDSEKRQASSGHVERFGDCGVDIPRTTNAIERFFRAFNRFYKVRCGFFSVISAKRESILFLLMYLFVQQPESGKAPIESIMPEVREMPLYKLINDPLRIVMGVENVKRNVNMADFALLQRTQV